VVHPPAHARREQQGGLKGLYSRVLIGFLLLELREAIVVAKLPAVRAVLQTALYMDMPFRGGARRLASPPATDDQAYSLWSGWKPDLLKGRRSPP
jgi:hypothetical protein